jgi:hypothetical protein
LEGHVVGGIGWQLHAYIIQPIFTMQDLYFPLTPSQLMIDEICYIKGFKVS